MVACKTESEELCSMEIGVPTNVRHVAHVTFDRFNGFLGLPVEFEPEVSKEAPSASANVFGVSTESMQLSYDSRGNSVPTILLLMQSRLYAQGGLRAEGIFRINGDNTQEEYVRDQLNRGVVPEDVDVHCLAGLIKAWFRELPNAVLDPLHPEQVMECHSEDDFIQLVKLLPPTEAALLDWAINLMVDVVQEENHNKMSARNVAMVFAPNMTQVIEIILDFYITLLQSCEEMLQLLLDWIHLENIVYQPETEISRPSYNKDNSIKSGDSCIIQMADPLTALMYAVQVMNFLKTLIEKTLRQIEKNSMIDSSPNSHIETSDENGSHSLSQTSRLEDSNHYEEKTKQDFVADRKTPLTFLGKSISFKMESLINVPTQADIVENELQPVANDMKAVLEEKSHKYNTVQSSNADVEKGSRKAILEPVGVAGALEKPRGPRVITRTNSRKEQVEAWH